MPNLLRNSFEGLVGILYPHYCAVCGSMLCRNENTLCLACYIELPRTGFHHDPENEVSRLFWGRVQLKNATAFMYFSKTSRYRQILHELKYKGQQDTGQEMGRIFGTALRGTSFTDVDMIHPVPLHPSKQKKGDIIRANSLQGEYQK